MTLINIRNLGVVLGNPLFEELNLSISKGDRIGLVAANGRGKSTFMACLTGEFEPTKGDITTARGLQVGFVKQNVPEDALDQTLYDMVLSALPKDQADYESWRIDVALGDLNVPFELQHHVLNLDN